MEGRKMRRNRIVEKIASGVLTIGMLAGIGMAAGSTANAADRNYGDRDQYHSSDFRDARDRDGRFRAGDRDDRVQINWGDGYYWFRDHDGRWIHERRSVTRHDDGRDRR